MKLVKVILRPEKAYEMKDALSGLGYHGITAKEVLGLGRDKIRSAKSETDSKKQNLEYEVFESFEHLNFGFVSNFVFWYSNFSTL